ncbi:MAG: hypothetical protein COB20_15295 [SAR86 cluster bacterium]|uniref:DUF4440 domain-containing protein n=1 Tax=SAR86 cluster bacterium TaxID=2030880 RepID=A0A2A4WVG0_9GAMM|nr:MAG: hypothetical protein COB20_15295 [SAR86 cluster bacterium]
MDSEISAIKEVLNQFAASICAGNFEQWMSFWSEDGVQMPPGSTTKVGKSEIREAMSPPFEAMNLQMVIHEIEDARISGDSGLTRCRYSLKGTPKNGGESVEIMPDGKALTLYNRQPDGSWKIVYDCFNSST